MTDSECPHTVIAQSRWIRVVVSVVSKGPGCSVESIEPTTMCGHPHSTIRTFCKGEDGAVTELIWSVGVMAEVAERAGCNVEPVQPVVGPNPEDATLVFVEYVDPVVTQACRLPWVMYMPFERLSFRSPLAQPTVGGNPNDPG